MTHPDDRQPTESLTDYVDRNLATGKNLEIVADHLVIRGAQEPEYPAGPEYGPYPYSDALEILDLTQVPGYTTSEPPGLSTTMSVSPINDEPDVVWVTSAQHRVRIHREDADPEHRLVEYRLAGAWFANLPA